MPLPEWVEQKSIDEIERETGEYLDFKPGDELYFYSETGQYKKLNGVVVVRMVSNTRGMSVEEPTDDGAHPTFVRRCFHRILKKGSDVDDAVFDAVFA